MPIITISRGSYSKGKEIAEKVAEKLGYSCVAREVLINASEDFNISAIKLAHALTDAPSIWERFTYGRERYLAYVKYSLLKAAEKDNMVYHGLAGHYFLRGIPNVLSVRIVADLEERLKEEMTRLNISRAKARKQLDKDDYDRRRWSLTLTGEDNTDPHMYDLIIHVNKLSVDDAADLIAHTSKLGHYQSTAESEKALQDRLLTAAVEVKLVPTYPNTVACAEDGIVRINVTAPLVQEAHLSDEFNDLLKTIPGVKQVRVNVVPTDVPL